MTKNEEELIEYGDAYIASKDAAVPKWLLFSYFFWVLVGLIWFWLYWNGSWGWADRGYWQELQTVAGTRYPVQNYNDPSEK